MCDNHVNEMCRDHDAYSVDSVKEWVSSIHGFYRIKFE